MIAAQPRPLSQDAKPRILARARALGFDLIGVASAQPFAEEQRTLRERRDKGYLDHWRYPDDVIAKICDPATSLPGARSIVCTATAYATAETPHDPYAPGLRGAVSAHSWGRDYHRVIGGRLQELAAFISSEYPGERCLACVDTGPLPERAAAVRAGIGWFGKSGNVLTKQFGSYVLLGEIITTLELAPDRPLRTHCGSCADCIPACPTGAIQAGGAVDATRCISDLTQYKGPIPRGLRKAIGNRLWGCDTCQTECRVNDRSRPAHAAHFAPLPAVGTSMDLPAVLRMTKSQFREWFGATSMGWRGKAVLQRNAAVALGNSRDARAIPHLVAALRDRKPLVRGHAAWALGEFGVGSARDALTALLQREDDAWVRQEAELALERC